MAAVRAVEEEIGRPSVLCGSAAAPLGSARVRPKPRAALSRGATVAPFRTERARRRGSAVHPHASESRRRGLFPRGGDAAIGLKGQVKPHVHLHLC
jgi:hypothetical protein